MKFVQDYFKDALGESVFDTPKLFTLVSKAATKTQYGPGVKVTLTGDDGETAEWQCTTAQYKKRFGDQGITEGQRVAIKLIKLGDGKKFYVVEPATASSAPTPTPPVPESHDAETVAHVNEVFAPEPKANHTTTKEYDLSFNQKDFGISRQGILQSLINSTSFDLKSDNDVAELEQLATDLTKRNREIAKMATK